MTPEQPRFWPSNPGHAPDQPQPENILHEAADELGRITGGELGAEIRTAVTGELLMYSFYVISEKIGYRHLLFRATTRLGFPVTIFDHPGSTDDADARLECQDSNELVQALRHVFEHPATQKIVGQLRNLSRAAS